MTVYGIGTDFVIIQWIAAPLAFTPETYSVRYREAHRTAESGQTLHIAGVNSNYSAGYRPKYSEILQNMESDTEYLLQVSNGNTYNESLSDPVRFRTLATGNFITLNILLKCVDS